MKKVLLATTILGMTAGFASAEIAFTGTAAAGFSSESGGDFEPYSKFELAVAATGESDSGLSFGASASISGGVAPDRGGDFAADGSDAMVAAAAAPGTDFFKPTIFVSGDFGKITVKSDGFKEYQDDNAEEYDLEYTHSIVGIDIGIRTDLDSTGTAAVNGASSIKLGYSINDNIKLSGAYDEVGDKWGISAAYTMNALTFTLATDDAEVTSLKVAYSANGISGSIKADTNDTWDLTAGYSANGLTVGAETNEADEWKVTTSYDLGGGLTAEAGYNASEDAYLGASMKF